MKTTQRRDMSAINNGAGWLDLKPPVTDPRTTDLPKFAVGNRVAFTHAYSAERIGNVLRRYWAGAWCYAVSDPIAGHGEWLLTEAALSPAES